MHGETLEDDYRAKAAEIGMEEADEKITKAYTSPQTSKYLQGIYEARQSVESKASDVKEMKNKVSKMRVREGTLNMESLELRAQERDLEDQVHIYLVHYYTRTSCGHRQGKIPNHHPQALLFNTRMKLMREHSRCPVHTCPL